MIFHGGNMNLNYNQQDYVLDNPKEFKRLEDQVLQKAYSLEDELRHLDLRPGDRVLDAGCGSAVLSKFLIKKVPNITIDACDYSDLRIQQAQNLNTQSERITYHLSDLGSLPFAEGTFDVVISRYVFEYLKNPIEICHELKRVLRPGGIVYLIDLDGVFQNFWTANSRFNELLSLLEKKLDFDLFVGRKLPSILNQAGFKNISWDASIHLFNESEEIQKEIQNNFTRLVGAKEPFSKILGGEEVFDEFFHLYLEEMKKIETNGNVLFFNKFLAWGRK